MIKSRTSYYKAGYTIHNLALKVSGIYQSEKASVKDGQMLLSYLFSNLASNGDKISLQKKKGRFHISLSYTAPKSGKSSSLIFSA